MKSFLVLFFTLVVAHGFCQEQSNPAVKQFLNEFVSNNEHAKNLYFKPTLHPKALENSIQRLDYKDSDSVFRDHHNRKVAFELSADEKKLIKETWISQQNKPWDSTILEHATIFREKPIPENFTKEQRLEYLHQFEGKIIVQFSMPVFLRNDSLCVFYYITYGGGSIFILRKEDGMWAKYLVIPVFYS
ncbi:hypothetical protein A4H97_33615 [Niastella yeongjuensis]|uniref:Uncharacterized protein n=1 Tax=Niastella yeongjuensis TaxID=354355 RepID=A0A1V9EDE6_9BACT|nr:hypothetical protein [Niastella yeongjuensis]OQP44143.1 hypothetical protein A4H97_33615 [Niastella yeongjuensis]SEO50278.1 hypothetical protein SAMN05660816_02874 [Niastella yeongjuensis]